MGTLTGIVNFGSAISPPLPGGEFSLIAVDGTHHALARLASTQCQIACAETQSYTTITQAQWRTDLASLAMGTSGTYTLCWRCGALGTSKFFIVGVKFGSPEDDVVWVRYSINAPGDIVVDGGGFYKNLPNEGIPQPSAFGGPAGQIVIGDSLFLAQELGVFFPFTRAFHLVELPLTGNDVDTSSNSWADHRKALPAAMADWTFFTTGTSRQYYNRAALYEDAEGVGILAYRGTAETEPQGTLYQTVIKTDGTNTGFNDVSATFGLPFSDANKQFDGAASLDARDDYTSPSINAVPGGLEVIFTRGFSDSRPDYRARKFLMDGIGDVTADGQFDFQLTDTPVWSEVEAIWLYREGDDLQAMMRDNDRFIFGFVPNPISEPPPATYPDSPTVVVDTVDELPPADAIIETQRWLLRTAHLRQFGEITVDDLRVTIKRGVGDTDFEPKIWVRALRDNRSWTKWVRRGLGKTGERIMTLYFGGFGAAKDWQFELATTDDCEIELRKVEIMPTQLGY